MKKFFNLIVFIFNVYAFQTFNLEVTQKFRDRLSMSEDKKNKRNTEQILSNYYSDQNLYSNDYYFEKQGFEKYKNFLYFIISLEDDDYISYLNQAKSYYLEGNKNSNGISFFTKLDIILALIFLVIILISFYFNKKYLSGPWYILR